MGNDKLRIHWAGSFNTLRLRQNGSHFADNIFWCISLNQNTWIWIKISLKFALCSPIDNRLTLVQIMAWRWIGAKPLSKPVMASNTWKMTVSQPSSLQHGNAQMRSYLMNSCNIAIYQLYDRKQTSPWIKIIHCFHLPHIMHLVSACTGIFFYIHQPSLLVTW